MLRRGCAPHRLTWTTWRGGVRGPATGVGPEEAWLAAERIRQGVAELRFDNLSGLS
jgi:hypothetical protein